MPLYLAKKFRELDVADFRRQMKDEDAVEDFWSYHLQDAFPDDEQLYVKKIKNDYTNMGKNQCDMDYVNYLNQVKRSLNPAKEKQKYLDSFINASENLSHAIQSTAVNAFKKKKGVVLQNIEEFNA